MSAPGSDAEFYGELNLDEARQYILDTFPHATSSGKAFSLTEDPSRGYLSLCWTDETDTDFQTASFPVAGGLDRILSAVQAHDRAHAASIWLRVTDMRKKPKRRGLAIDSWHLSMLFCDIDIEGPAHKHDPDKCGCGFTQVRNEAEALTLITESGLPEPTSWVHSGNGMYPLWRLVEPIDIEGDQGQAAELLKTWQGLVAHQARAMQRCYTTETADLSRILRLPGTVNRKPVVPSQFWERCQVVSSDGPRYTMVQLLHAAGAALKALPPASQVQVLTGVRPPAAGAPPWPPTGPPQASSGPTAGLDDVELTPIQRFKQENGSVETVLPWLLTWGATDAGPYGDPLGGTGRRICKPGSKPGQPQIDLWSNGTVYAFSPKCSPFKAGIPYDVFDVYLITKYGEGWESHRNREVATLRENYAARDAAARATASIDPDGDASGKAMGGDGGAPSPPIEAIGSVEIPEPLRKRQIPILGEEAKYGLPWLIVQAVDSSTEADPNAILFCILAITGNYIGRDVFARADHKENPGRIWPLLIGDSQIGKKGSAISVVKELINRIDSNYIDKCYEPALASGEGMVEMVANPTKKSDSLEEEAEAESVDKRKLIILEEFGSLLAKSQQKGSILSGIIRESYDGARLSVPTRNNPIMADGHHFSFIGATTPDDIRGSLTSAEMTNGFGNRFMPTYSIRSKVLPFDVEFDPELIEPALARYREILTKFRGKRVKITFTDAGGEVWEKYYREMSDRVIAHTPSASLTNRWAPNTLRTAVVYALMDGVEKMDAVHVRAAISCWGYVEDTIHYIFNDEHLDEDLQSAIESINSSPTLSRTRKEIRYDVYKNGKGAASLDALKARLVATGRYEVVKIRNAAAGGGAKGGPIPEHWRKINKAKLTNSTKASDDIK